ncbi:MAG: hypothetical protein U5K56_09970 [Halioglobus sp.]|nr:hypothetical protein [Halioglobus sp.]
MDQVVVLPKLVNSAWNSSPDLRRGQQGPGLVPGAVREDTGEGDTGQHALVALDRRPLEAVLLEHAGADEPGPARAVVVVGPQFHAPLVSLGILHRLEQVGPTAVGIEYFVGIELAVVVDVRQAPGLVQVVGQRERIALDFAFQAQASAEKLRGARADRSQLGLVERGRVSPGGGQYGALEGGARRRIFLVLQYRLDQQVVHGARIEDQAGGEGVLSLQVLCVPSPGAHGLAGTVQVLDVAVALFVDDGQTRAQCVAHQRARDHAAEAPLVEVAEAGGGLALEFVGRFVGDDADRSDAGGGAEQRGLGTLDDLDAIDVEQFHSGAPGARDVDAVLVDGHPGLTLRAAGVGGDAADDEGGIVGALLLHHQAGHEGGQPVEALDAQALEKVLVVGGDRQRHIGGGLRPFLCGDDHLLQQILCGGRKAEGGADGGGEECSGKGAFHGDRASRSMRGCSDSSLEHLPNYDRAVGSVVVT